MAITTAVVLLLAALCLVVDAAFTICYINKPRPVEGPVRSIINAAFLLTVAFIVVGAGLRHL